MNCRVCGSDLPDGAMFCGECGSSVTVTRVRRRAVADPRPSDTTIVQPLPGPAVAGPEFPVREADPKVSDESNVRDAPSFPDVPDVVDPPDAVPEVSDVVVAPDASVTPDVMVAPVVSFRFALSTGESVAITGSGLLGRRPITQPGEHVDQIVSVADLTRSVSKTHLEFGLEGSELWISDRYSGNGTVLRPLGGRARLCEPGRRYRVPRGTRVEIGDHYFDVS
ncbi:MAG: hypothetical protein QOE16_1401 [Microbacteriaceae bacterium]|jgi:hypothetical protein|nr:hypothetical protein [Microbacteriaceae bacterium]